MKAIWTEEGNRMSGAIGAVKYVECSDKTQVNLKNAFDLAIQATLDHRNNQKNKASTGCGCVLS